MAFHNDFGKQGEELAEKFLLRNGFTILFRNWRYSYFEIDIIALKDDRPHFVEVKIRSSTDFGFPEDSVTKKKIRKLLRAADQFMFLNPQYKDFRIDILSIISFKPEETVYFFIEDVYL